MNKAAVIVLAGTAAAAWFLMARQAEAAVMPSQNLAPSNPGANVSGPAAILSLVRQINEAEFSGFFDPALIMGIIETESSYDPGAYRWEDRLGEASYGLMQVLESTARDRGLVGPVEQLFDPVVGIRFGMRQLKWSWDYLAQRIGPPSRLQLLSAYNAGVGYVAKGGTRAAYAVKVERAAGNWIGVA